jgi:hypothetical protein
MCVIEGMSIMAQNHILFGIETTDTCAIIDKKFYANVDPKSPKSRSWHGKVLGVQTRYEHNEGSRLITTVGTFRFSRSVWRLELPGRRLGPAAEFHFEK